jgi:superfamily I DNA and/or RNA helicase
LTNQLSKVAQDLRAYTCDAMLGHDLTANVTARRKAQKRIKDARLIFTTCIGAGLGLLRSEDFDVVIVDEASQLTEPATLVPLTKGCSRAILVGDHVQLRATVQQHALLTNYDVSLFERHYKLPPRAGIAKVMLDTQYRMHRSICDFSSSEFYNGNLHTAVADHARPLSASLFPWPETNRMVWVECAAPEDVGYPSKSNTGQATLCKQVTELLRTSQATTDTTATPEGSDMAVSIAVLTPYTRQKTLLATALPSIEVSSIDGFQGREADIIVFVTVRCNAHGDLGFLTDMRRLNVVMTRARAGVVLIGNRSTVTGVGAGVDADDSRMVWRRLVERCDVVQLPAPAGGRT